MDGWQADGVGMLVAQQLVGIFAVNQIEVGPQAVRCRGFLLARPEVALRVLRERLEPRGLYPLIQSEHEVVVVPVPRQARRAEDRVWVNALLFLATVLTTLFVGAYHAGKDPLADWNNLWAGWPFSACILSILVCHELGHYFTARHYGIEVTLPYFIPAPIGLGTFGAFIKMRSPVTDRKALFDVAIAGPLAGLVLAIPILIIGLTLSQVVPLGDRAGIGLGSPPLFSFIAILVVGRVPEGFDVVLHPVAFAGWIGFFVTALNLLPLGQLDGGHIAYALWGKRATHFGMATALVLGILGLHYWPGWLFWAFLAFVLGFRHPPLMDDVTPLDPRRRLGAYGAFILLLLLITPAPFILSSG
ncbi:MAG: site-2 protease family protein [Candidatus Methylomirabilales bacterium]